MTLLVTLGIFILGPIGMFLFIRRGWGLLWPASACLVLGVSGMGAFAYGMMMTPPVELKVAGTPLYATVGFLLALGAVFFSVLLAIVLIARFVSGEYRIVKSGDEK